MNISIVVSIVIFSLMFATGAYFVAKGLFGAVGFCGVIMTSAIAVAIVQNIDTFTSLGLKTGTVDVSVEVARVRDEIFAKAEEVQQLVEQSAAISAWVVSTANRLVGEAQLCRRNTRGRWRKQQRALGLRVVQARPGKLDLLQYPRRWRFPPWC